MPASPTVPPPGSLRLKMLNALTRTQVEIYKRTGGRMANKIKGAPVLLLDHVGRKSGQARTSPVLYMADGNDLVIVASRGGSEATPAWWLNLKASPDTTVTVGPATRRMVARQASPEEKRRLWPRLLEIFPDFAVYQRRTSRDIPVIILSPAA